MSAQSLAGLALFNLFLLAVGAGLLWGIRGWVTWVEFLRLSGVAYFLGVAGLMTVATLELVLGVPYSLGTLLLSGLVLGAAGVFWGRRRRRPGRGRLVLPSGGVALATAVFVGLAVVYLEGLFRAGRLRGLQEWDAWAFWVPKAKAIYLFGDLDAHFFSSLPGPTYPPLVPALQASAFHFMGSADVVTLHLQYWFLLVGFVAAAAGLLLPRVSPLLVWPSLFLLLATPQIGEYALAPQGDLLLDWLFALCALLVGLWIVERRAWMLPAATVLAAAAIVTKREGLLFIACLFAAAFAVTLRSWRVAWPRLALAGAVALVPAVSWQVWVASQDLGGGGPEQGIRSLLREGDRTWDSLELALSTVFDYDVWLLLAPVAIAAVLLALAAGCRTLPAYFGLLFILLTLGFAWTVWAFPSLPLTKNQAISPIIRETGALIVLSALLVPLLLQAAWGMRQRGEPVASPRRDGTRAWAAPALVAVAALAYSAAVVSRGVPPFPSRADCMRPPVQGRPLEVVFGRSDSAARAHDLERQALGFGFQGTQVVHDGCGLLKVALPGVPSLEVGAEVLEEARSVDLHATLESSG